MTVERSSAAFHLRDFLAIHNGVGACLAPRKHLRGLSTAPVRGYRLSGYYVFPAQCSGWYFYDDRLGWHAV